MIQVETRSYSEYVNYLLSLRLKSGLPGIATYEQWARMCAEG